MSKQHEGGPAFPHLSRIVAANIYEPISEGGMTLRDYFAAKTITDAQIDAIANGMPGGLDGFLKGWGWRHFARAILAASNGEAAVPTPAQVQEGQ